MTHPATIYDRPSGDVYAPVTLTSDPMDRLILMNFEGPEYAGLEFQLFDDEVKGRGAAALMWHNDDVVDFYMTPGLTLDPEDTEVGAGVGKWITTEIDYHFEITDEGVDVHVAFELDDGRLVDFTTREHRPRPTQPLTILAPAGGGVQRPKFLPFFRLHDIDLVWQKGTEIDWRIGDTARTPIKLPPPMPFNGRRVYFLRYSPDPLIGLINPQHDGPLPELSVQGVLPGRYGDIYYDLVDNAGHREIRQVATQADRHTLHMTFTPALPNVTALADGAQVQGRFGIGVDDATDIVAGEYEVVREAQEVRITMQPTEKWQPRGGPLVRLTFLFFPSAFRTWPLSYRWTGTVTLLDAGAPTMVGRWARVED